jgi:CRP/FNR family transcriptional regulator, nitrogen fixation regulation protein
MAILVSTEHQVPMGKSDTRGSSQLPQRFDALATMVRASLCEPLYRAGDAAGYWYRLVAGAACECVQTADGRRQIVDFLLPGDLFGFCSRERHEFSVEVIVDGSTFARYPRRRAEELASADAEIAGALRRQAFESISRLQSRMVLLGRTNALEKVSAFLIEMADRTSRNAGDALVLPMSRYDIADYLAMAVETVSRALTTLRARGAITLAGSRMVRITNRRALEYLGTDPLQSCAFSRDAFGSAVPSCSPPHPANLRASPGVPAAG